MCNDYLLKQNTCQVQYLSWCILLFAWKY